LTSAPKDIVLYAAAMNEPNQAELDELIARATVDCYNEDEELTGFATMIGDNLAVPFETTVLGVTVTVKKIGYTDSGIVAICARGELSDQGGGLRAPGPRQLAGLPRIEELRRDHPGPGSQHQRLLQLPRPRRHRILPVLRRHPPVKREPQPAVPGLRCPAALFRPGHQHISTGTSARAVTRTGRWDSP